ncbi:hypothetical protein [Paenibacillus mesophilus]|uniref:hypothetical protein n=1 Tax=Paenibacillus mesophilus TaxID=2582849 RepID=UPI001305386D|nr:hypothetical protein [Paenibacillus mesophilus]
MRASTYGELQQWREHVRFCLDWHKKDNNWTEVDDCEYLLRVIEEQMALLKRSDSE